MAEQSAQTIDSGRFHFEIGDAVGTIGKPGEAVDQFRLAEAETKHPALRSIEPRAGYRYALVKPVGKMPEERGAGAADIGLRQAMVQLGLGRKGMEEFDFLFV